MKKILIVEDEIDIQKILRSNLEHEGYTVVTTDKGQEALALALTEKPDAVILDVMLPDMNGFDVCRQMKQENELLKVIIYTGKLEAVDAKRARAVGADDFTVKTVDFKYILSSLRKLTSG